MKKLFSALSFLSAAAFLSIVFKGGEIFRTGHLFTVLGSLLMLVMISQFFYTLASILKSERDGSTKTVSFVLVLLTGFLGAWVFPFVEDLLPSSKRG